MDKTNVNNVKIIEVKKVVDLGLQASIYIYMCTYIIYIYIYIYMCTYIIYIYIYA
jgi:hypothetical protein